MDRLRRSNLVVMGPTTKRYTLPRRANRQHQQSSLSLLPVPYRLASEVGWGREKTCVSPPPLTLAVHTYLFLGYGTRYGVAR